jgi:hypothetical protein
MFISVFYGGLKRGPSGGARGESREYTLPPPGVGRLPGGPGDGKALPCGDRMSIFLTRRTGFSQRMR